MIHFGTGGWRAVIGDGFTKANVQLLTLALARKMLDEGRADKGFVIGYDRRFLSEEAAGWAAEVMAGQGILCRIIHRESPTPLIMYTVAAYGLPYGMAITASPLGHAHRAQPQPGRLQRHQGVYGGRARCGRNAYRRL